MMPVFAFVNPIPTSFIFIFLSLSLLSGLSLSCQCWEKQPTTGITFLSRRRPRSSGERGFHGPEGSPLHCEPGPLQPSHLHDLLVGGGESHQGETLLGCWPQNCLVCPEYWSTIGLWFFLSDIMWSHQCRLLSHPIFCLCVDLLNKLDINVRITSMNVIHLLIAVYTSKRSTIPYLTSLFLFISVKKLSCSVRNITSF